MSETPGQVLGRLLIEHGIGVAFDYSDEGDREAVAAAFLAEVDTETLLKAAKARVGHSDLGGWEERA